MTNTAVDELLYISLIKLHHDYLKSKDNYQFLNIKIPTQLLATNALYYHLDLPRQGTLTEG
jgi:hypothetical protein